MDPISQTKGQRSKRQLFHPLRWLIYVFNSVVNTILPLFPMAMYCCCHCFLYPRTECIMMYNVVRGCAEIVPERLQCGCLVGQQGRLEISDTLPPTTANQCKDNFPMPSISALLPLFFFFFLFFFFANSMRLSSWTKKLSISNASYLYSDPKFIAPCIHF